MKGGMVPSILGREHLRRRRWSPIKLRVPKPTSRYQQSADDRQTAVEVARVDLKARVLREMRANEAPIPDPLAPHGNTFRTLADRATLAIREPVGAVLDTVAAAAAPKTNQFIILTDKGSWDQTALRNARNLLKQPDADKSQIKAANEALEMYRHYLEGRHRKLEKVHKKVAAAKRKQIGEDGW